MKNGRVLVLGAAGMLGGTLVPMLTSAGYEVIRHGRHPRPDLIDVHADLADTHLTVKLLQTVKPEAVVNLAALSNVDRCESEPHESYVSNLLSAVNVSRAVQVTPGVHAIHFSTDHVYDGPGPHTELHVMIRNSYAQTKRAAELVMEHCHATIVRTNFFGPSSVADRRSLSDWIIQSLEENHAIPVYTDVFFSPLTMNSLSKIVLELIAIRPKGIFNVGSRDGMSKCQFAFAVAEAKRLPLSLLNPVSSETASPTRARRPKDTRMIVAAVEKILDHNMPTLASEIETLR